jgi:hypothetical protein
VQEIAHPAAARTGRILYIPREKFWRFEAPEYPDLVPPLLIYADLLATADDRNIETARKLYDERLAELIETD